MGFKVYNETYRLGTKYKRFSSSRDAGLGVISIPTDDLLSWYDSETVSLSGSTVTQLTDKMGNHNLTGSYGPTYSASALKGYASLTFNGSSNRLASDSFTLAQPFTIFGAVSADTLTDQMRLLSSLGGDSGLVYLYSSRLTMFSGGQFTPSNDFVLAGEPFVFMAKFNSSSSAFKVGTRAKETGDPSTGGWSSGFCLGANSGQSGNYFNGKFYEMLIYNAAIGDTDAATIISYLQGKYGLISIGDNPISTSPLLWLDASSADWITKDGSNYVSLLRDRSGNHLSVGQATASYQPLYGSGTGITFDGSNDRLLSAASVTQAQAFTVFIVLNQKTWNSTGRIFATSTGGTETGIAQYPSTPGMKILAGGEYSGTAETGLAVNTRGILCAQFNGTSSFIRVNAGTATSSSATTGGLQDALALGSLIGGGCYANIAIEEFQVYPGALGTSDETSVRNYLNTKHTVF